MIEPIKIAQRPVGPGRPCFIIAEAGVNHNGDVAMARRLIDAAAEAKVDAVKFQTFKANRLVSKDAPKAKYQTETTDSTESQYEMIRKLELSDAAHRDLMAHCAERGVTFMSSPFDEESADFLDALSLPAFKIPSGEITNLPFLTHVAQKKRPVILSTGMAAQDEVAAAVEAIRNAGNPDLILLQCVSNYPADPADCNLCAMATMAEAFDVPVGYSDHVIGNEVAFAAVALGACVIEKHFTLDRTLPGPDHRASLEPAGLADLVRGIRAVEASLGDGVKQASASEADTARVARKSIVAACNIPSGSVLTEEMLVIQRPGTGLAPSRIQDVLGQKTLKKVAAGSLLRLEDLA